MRRVILSCKKFYPRIFIICIFGIVGLSVSGQSIMPVPRTEIRSARLDTNTIVYNEKGEPLRFYQYNKLINSGEYAIRANGPLGAPDTKSFLKKLAEQDKARMYAMIKPRIAIKSPELQEGTWLNVKPLLENIDGIQLDRKAIIMIFWYVGCEPCMESFADINELFKQVDLKDAVILAVTPNGQSIAEAKLKDKPLLYARLVSNAETIINAYQPGTYPSYVVTDKSHVIKYAVAGTSPITLPEFKNAVKSVLNQ